MAAVPISLVVFSMLLVLFISFICSFSLFMLLAYVLYAPGRFVEDKVTGINQLNFTSTVTKDVGHSSSSCWWSYH